MELEIQKKANAQKESGSIDVKPYCTIELCQMYQVGRKTLRKWLIPFAQEIGERRGRYYTVLQVRIIFDKLGVPHKIFEQRVVSNL